MSENIQKHLCVCGGWGCGMKSNHHIKNNLVELLLGWGFDKITRKIKETIYQISGNNIKNWSKQNL